MVQLLQILLKSRAIVPSNLLEEERHFLQFPVTCCAASASNCAKVVAASAKSLAVFARTIGSVAWLKWRHRAKTLLR